MTLLSAGFIFLSVWLWLWIQKLESTGCECSKEWRRNFLKIYFIGIVIVNIMSLIYFLVYSDSFIERIPFLSILLMILNIVYTIVAIQYSRNLKMIKCECSDELRRDVLFIWGMINAISYGIIIFMALVGSILYAINYNPTPNTMSKTSIKKSKK